MRPPKDRLKVVLDIIHSIGVPILSIVALVAMIKLWDWNVQYSGTVFAIFIIVLPAASLILSIVHTFNLWDKFKVWKANRKK